MPDFHEYTNIFLLWIYFQGYISAKVMQFIKCNEMYTTPDTDTNIDTDNDTDGELR